MQEDSWKQRENEISCIQFVRKQTPGYICSAYPVCAAMLKPLSPCYSHIEDVHMQCAAEKWERNIALQDQHD